jgi:hypothetical protein
MRNAHVSEPQREHPPLWHLELAALGAAEPSHTAHVNACEQCRALVDQLQAAAAAPIDTLAAARYLQALRSSHERERARHRTWLSSGWAAAGAVSTGLAAAVWLFAPQDLRPPSAVESSSAARGPRAQPSDLKPKGVARLSLIRQRGAEQTRFDAAPASGPAVPSGVTATVRAGDKLRLEFQIAAKDASAGILTDTGDWISIFEGKVDGRPQAPLFTLEVVDPPSPGRVLVGPSAEVLAVRQGGPASAVLELRLDWERSP